MAFRGAGIAAAAVLGAVTAFARAPLWADEALPLLAPGDRIRYRLFEPGRSAEAVILETEVPPDGPERWLIRSRDGTPAWIDRANVRRLDLYRGKGSSIRKSCLIGLVIGIAVPGVFTAAWCPECGAEAILLVGPHSGAMGAGLGALIGARRPAKWETVIRDRPRRPQVMVGPMRGPRGGGMGLGVAVAF